MTIMLAIIVAAPLVRAAALWLAAELPAPDSPVLIRLSIVSLAVLAVSMPLVGWYGAPVRMSLPELDLLFTTSLPRARMLVGRIARVTVSVMFACAALAALLFAARMVQGEAHWQALTSALGWGACIGLCVSLLLLAGQMVRGTRWQSLREQAQRLDVVSTLVATGEFRSAAGRITAPVTTGRNWRWRPAPRANRSGLLLIMSRDLFGIVRTPARSFASLLCIGAGGAVIGAVSGTLSAGTAALAGAVALLTVYASVGPICRGLRVAGETAGASPLLPFESVGLLWRHLAVPAMLSALVSVAASVTTASVVQHTAVRIAASAASAASTAACSALLVCVLALALRLLGTLKGPLPQSMLAPIPTPVGDLASINVLLWNLDGPILAVLLGAGLAAIAVWSFSALLVATALVLLVLLVWARMRLRAAEGG